MDGIIFEDPSRQIFRPKKSSRLARPSKDRALQHDILQSQQPGPALPDQQRSINSPCCKESAPNKHGTDDTIADQPAHDNHVCLHDLYDLSEDDEHSIDGATTRSKDPFSHAERSCQAGESKIGINSAPGSISKSISQGCPSRPGRTGQDYHHKERIDSPDPMLIDTNQHQSNRNDESAQNHSLNSLDELGSGKNERPSINTTPNHDDPISNLRNILRLNPQELPHSLHEIRDLSDSSPGDDSYHPSNTHFEAREVVWEYRPLRGYRVISGEAQVLVPWCSTWEPAGEYPKEQVNRVKRRWELQELH